MFSKRSPVARPAAQGSGKKHAIVFVHGLGGSTSSTWGQMLALLGGDTSFAECTLDCYEYPTRLINLPYLAEPPGLKEIAEGLKTFLYDRYMAFDRVDLVAHSLGGVVVKQFVVQALNSTLTLPLRKIALIAVPNSGSSLALIGEQVSYRHRQLKSLCKKASDLEALETAWRDSGAEGKIAVQYLMGGVDRCVSRDSACPEGAVEPAMLINAGHRNIVEPADVNDTRYTVLTKFLLDKHPKPVGAMRPADPLFDIYTAEQEKYYIERRFDHALSKAISAGHLWLTGRSGVGKTAALRRAALRNGWKLGHVNLSAYQDGSPVGMLNALSDELSLLASRNPLGGERNLENACRGIRSNLDALCKDDMYAIVVEELPLDIEALPQFLTGLSKVFQVLSGADHLNCRVVFAFSSISDPTQAKAPISAKVRDNLQLLQIPTWDMVDLERLVEMVARHIRPSLSKPEMAEIAVAARGLPRFVKMVFRQFRSGAGEMVSLQTLLERVASEQL